MNRIEIIKNDIVVSTSKNLRGILDYARSAGKNRQHFARYWNKQVFPNRITPGAIRTNGILEIEYCDGATSGSFFRKF